MPYQITEPKVNDEFRMLYNAAMNQDNLVDVNPFISAIRVEFGPRLSLFVFQNWREQYDE